MKRTTKKKLKQLKRACRTVDVVQLEDGANEVIVILYDAWDGSDRKEYTGGDRDTAIAMAHAGLLTYLECNIDEVPSQGYVHKDGLSEAIRNVKREERD